MEVAAEIYKGIMFVRVSSLPEEQKKLIWKSFSGQKIIKILRGKELLDDCLQYEEYQNWYHHHYKPAMVNETLPEKPGEFRLAFE